MLEKSNVKLTLKTYQVISYLTSRFDINYSSYEVKDNEVRLTFFPRNKYSSEFNNLAVKEIGLQLVSKLNLGNTIAVTDSTPTGNIVARIINVDGKHFKDDSSLGFLTTETEYSHVLFSDELLNRIENEIKPYIIDGHDMDIENEYRDDLTSPYFAFFGHADDRPLEEALDRIKSFELRMCSVKGFEYMYGVYGWMVEFFKEGLPDEFFVNFTEIITQMSEELAGIVLMMSNVDEYL